MDTRPFSLHPARQQGGAAGGYPRDALTGLLSRQGVLNHLRRWLQQQPRQRIGVVLLDVVRFRDINRRHGQVFGDRWLRAFAGRLREQRWPGAVVGRAGGAQFLLLCRGQALLDGGLQQCTARLAQALSGPVEVAGIAVDHRVAFGVAVADSRQPAVCASTLIDEAERSLRQMAAGGARDPNLAALGEAIDRGEPIEVHYQPEIDLLDGRLCGVEALARWRHPQHGLLNASRFIALAERSGLVVPLSQLVLERAIEQCARWRRHHRELGLCVRVNVSPLQVVAADFIDEVVGLLMVHSLPASALCLEVTEHSAMARCERLYAPLAELRELGVQVAIDDFGVGHSSLSRLAQMPVDCLKIDRSFVAAIGRGGRDRALLGNIAALARDCGLQVVAEGIETRDQLSHLRELSIDRGQGLLISPALAAAAIEPLFGQGVCQLAQAGVSAPA